MNFVRPLIACLLLGTLMTTGCGGGAGGDAATPQVTTKASLAPAGVTATSGIHQITLTWNPVAGAESYNIYWSDTPGVTPATGTKINGAVSPYIHSGLTVSKTYFYVVTAVIGGIETIASDQAATVAATDGANLYDQFCFRCHGDTTNIVNGTAENIKAAIAGNKGGMGSLWNLPDDTIAKISQRLPCH